MEKFNKFKYTDAGICLNPEVPYRFGEWNRHHFEIRVSEAPRGWVYGYMWGTHTAGGATGCRALDREVFPTRSEAIAAAARQIKGRCGDDTGAAGMVRELDRIIDMESGHKPTLKQHTIFDYL